MKPIWCVSSLLLLLFLHSCNKEDVIISPESSEESLMEEYIMSNDVLERAYQMATIKWTPIKSVPMTGGSSYRPGVTVTGVPYSSVKEINTYLFQDVSYYTFMTAVHNPNSVLYTEDLSLSPYHGINCGTYYGAVCSSSVMWCLGIDIPYYANQIIKLPSMKRLDCQQIDSLKICDVIWKSGHVQMVYNIEYKADTIYKITMFESSITNAHLTEYSKEQFQKMWADNRYVGYRYKKLKQSTTSRHFQSLDTVIYNDDLCPSKGDKSVYRTTDTVLINIFNDNYENIILSDGKDVIISEKYNGGKHIFMNLQPGIYYVSLSKEQEQTAPISFEIIETKVKYTLLGNGFLTVYFESSANPKYAALCDIYGNSLYYPISNKNKLRGYISVPMMDNPEFYCKVVFDGEYGSIINEPIRVKR